MSYAADGISLLASGKTLTDHAISAVARRDCALWRLITRQALCFGVDPAIAGELVLLPPYPAAKPDDPPGRAAATETAEADTYWWDELPL